MACDLMLRTGAFINGVQFTELNHVVFSDALAKNPDVVVVVSSIQGRLVGYVLAIKDEASYWRKFWFRHSKMAVWMFFRKVVNKLHRIATVRFRPKPTLSDWKESSPWIAKISHIGVAEDYRGQGIGKGLYRHLFQVMAEQGIRRVDANIGLDNVPSIRLHEKMGWRIERTASNFFATIDLKTTKKA